MKIELTIKTSYLPTWGAREGIRELLQNGRDAEADGAELEVDYKAATRTLRICNRGAVLPHEALLLGHTTKVGRDDQAGQFGEGLKLGILALVRAGHPVKIRSGSEVWIPTIQRSERFHADVLVFDVQGGRADEQRVRVEIGGISPEVWDEAKEDFLFLRGRKLQAAKTRRGSLLLAEQDRGRVFVKGIFVERDDELSYGYDLADVRVDRDRRVLDRWDRDQAIHTIWTEALSLRPDLASTFVKLLDEGAQDVQGVRDWNVTSLPEAAVEAVVETFQARHGEGAVPVETLGDSRDIEHLGRKGVVVSKQLATVLGTKLGSLATVKEGLRKEVTSRVGWGELTAEEQDSIVDAAELIARAVPGFDLDCAEIVEFRSPSLLGQFVPATGHVLVARRVLTDRDETLATLVHEVAHKVSANGDGEKGHVQAIEEVWMKIVASLRGRR